ncbi:MAG: hypothetical protein ACP5VQ_06215 [Phycisphaerae bacterium]
MAILSLNCGAVLDLAMRSYAGKQQGEPALFRMILSCLETGDILLANRYYALYWIMALLLERGADSLFRQHQLRRIDFRAGCRLGPSAAPVEIVYAGSRHRVGNRPDRYEPRAVKRRAKPITFLTVPRQQARHQLIRKAIAA